MSSEMPEPMSTSLLLSDPRVIIKRVVRTGHSSMRIDWKPEISKRLTDLSGLEVKEYSHVDFGRDQNPDCISIVIEEKKTGQNPFQAVVGLIDGVFRNPIAQNNAEKLLKQLRPQLPSGYVAFIGTTHWLGTFKPHGVELVVGPGESQFEIVRHAKSDACNYDLTNENLIERLQKYDKEFGIDITHAETDTIDFELLRVPDNITLFTEDLYEFCPDLVDQGCGSVSALVEEIRRTRRIQLWWD